LRTGTSRPRRTTDQGKEIPSGGHWVLDIARQGALQTATENDLAPGFVFLEPNDKEVFVAPGGLGTTGSRYGGPMRVKIRVAPRSQPQRYLENAVTLQITEQCSSRSSEPIQAPRPSDCHAVTKRCHPADQTAVTEVSSHTTTLRTSEKASRGPARQCRTTVE
jgi:hypothetical protein